MADDWSLLIEEVVLIDLERLGGPETRWFGHCGLVGMRFFVGRTQLGQRDSSNQVSDWELGVERQYSNEV